jgi:hypothetical protein
VFLALGLVVLAFYYLQNQKVQMPSDEGPPLQLLAADPDAELPPHWAP